MFVCVCVWSANPVDNASQLLARQGRGRGGTQCGGVALLDCLVPVQIVLPFIAPEVANDLMATACWANAQQILLVSVCLSVCLCMHACTICVCVWQPKPFALHVATFELGSVLQPLCSSTNKCHFQHLYSSLPLPRPEWHCLGFNLKQHPDHHGNGFHFFSKNKL